MRFSKSYCIAFILILLLESCVQDLTMDPGGERELILNCILTEDSTQTLSLFYAKGTGELEYVPVTDASVFIVQKKDENGEKAYFTYCDDGTWKASFSPQHTVRYLLKAELPNGKKLSAETTFPEDVQVTCMARLFSDFPPIRGFSYEVRKTATRNDYLYDIYPTSLNNGPHAYAGPLCQGECRMWIRGYESGIGSPLGVSIMTDHAGADDFNLTSLKLSDVLDFSHLENLQMRAQYEWMTDYYSNIGVHHTWLHIIQPFDYDNGYKNDESDRGIYNSTKAFILANDYKLTEYGLYTSLREPLDYGRYEFFFVSKEYDNYLTDLYRRDRNMQKSLAYIYDTQSTYSNIEGGLGVFGAVLCRKSSQRININQ